MKHNNALQFVLIVILLFANPVSAETTLKEKIYQLNDLSEELLEIDIYSATLLVSLEGTVQFIPFELLDEKELRRWRNLERKGYVLLNLLDKMPGADYDEKTLSIVRTDAGKEVQQWWLSTKKHIKSLKWDLPYCGFLELVDFENGLCHF